jgi:hypothetical protein
MKTNRFLMIGTALCGLTLAAVPRQIVAQEAGRSVVYASYYECDPTRVAGADSLVRSFWTPLIDSHVAAKHALAWGWIGHHTGSAWSRAFYVVAPDVDNAVTVIEAVVADALKANAAAVNATNAACPVHEDYIWQRVTGSQASADFAHARPAAGLNIYYECDPAREQRADAIMTSTIAPILNQLVTSGDLNTWSWLEHIIGGKYRRLLVTDGRDAKTLLGAIGKSVAELRGKQAAAFGEFSGICNSHQDMIWNMLVAKP